MLRRQNRLRTLDANLPPDGVVPGLSWSRFLYRDVYRNGSRVAGVFFMRTSQGQQPLATLDPRFVIEILASDLWDAGDTLPRAPRRPVKQVADTNFVIHWPLVASCLCGARFRADTPDGRRRLEQHEALQHTGQLGHRIWELGNRMPWDPAARETTIELASAMPLALDAAHRVAIQTPAEIDAQRKQQQEARR